MWQRELASVFPAALTVPSARNPGSLKASLCSLVLKLEKEGRTATVTTQAEQTKRGKKKGGEGWMWKVGKGGTETKQDAEEKNGGGGGLKGNGQNGSKNAFLQPSWLNKNMDMALRILSTAPYPTLRLKHNQSDTSMGFGSKVHKGWTENNGHASKDASLELCNLPPPPRSPSCLSHPPSTLVVAQSEPRKARKQDFPRGTFMIRERRGRGLHSGSAVHLFLLRKTTAAWLSLLQISKLMLNCIPQIPMGRESRPTQSWLITMKSLCSTAREQLLLELTRESASKKWLDWDCFVFCKNVVKLLYSICRFGWNMVPERWPNIF